MSVCGLLAATTHAGVIGGQKISRILEVGRCISVISICSLSPGMLKRAGRMRKGAAACSAADNNFFVLRSASSGPRGVLEYLGDGCSCQGSRRGTGSLPSAR